MRNQKLVEDYLERAQHRLSALEVLMEKDSYADVVREAQEVVELSLKALLRSIGIEVPRVHDVSKILKEHQDLLSESLQNHVSRLAKISHQLRRDRELAFYGSEDLTPSEFYEKEDAEQAFEDAKWVVHLLRGELISS